MKTLLRLVCANVPLLATACLAAEPLEVGSSAAAIIDGEVTEAFTGVGLIRGGTAHGCSSAMIGPRKLLTAAHCFKYESRANEGALVTFGQVEATLRGVRSLGGRPGSSDIAVAEVDRDLSGLVEVYSVARLAAEEGTPAAIVGWGCIAKEWNDELHEWTPTAGGGQLKRFREVTYTSNGPGLRQDAGCPGDSGGPVFRWYPETGEYSEIIGVTSASPAPSDDDSPATILGQPVSYRDQIEAFCIAPDSKHQGCDGPDLGGPGIDYECGAGNHWVEVGGFCENIHH